MKGIGYFKDELERIVQDDISDGSVDLEIRWTNRTEGTEAIKTLSQMKQDLKLLKRELTAEMTELRRYSTEERSKIGSGIGNEAAAMFLGRRIVGRANAMQKQQIRLNQIEMLQPYETIKNLIDKTVVWFDKACSEIKTSAEFQAPQLKKATPKVNQFYIYLNDRVLGPYTTDETKALIRTSMLNPDSLICKDDGKEEWVSLKTLREFC